MDEQRAVEAVADLHPALWGALLRAVRRAADEVPRGELPPALRPYATWKTDRLAHDRPRRAIATALVRDARLREVVATHLERPDAYEAATDQDPARLAAAYGQDHAIAALVAHARWDDVVTLGAEAALELSARDRAAAEASLTSRVAQAESTRQRATEELNVVREERDAQRRRAEEAERRAEQAERERRQNELRAARLEAELSASRDAVAAERRKAQERQSRLRRRAEDAEQRARMDDARVKDVAEALEALAADLRKALEVGPAAQGALPAAAPVAAGAVPRDIAAAAPGRPSALPLGLSSDDPDGVRSLLQIPRMLVILDGYNVTKDAAGLPGVGLAEQRQWLVRLAAGVAARFGVRTIVVFDGTEPGPSLPSPRGVLAVFTTGDETADGRIVGIVSELGPSEPVLVVSSDRQVREDCQALGADVTYARTFLTAVGQQKGLSS